INNIRSTYKKERKKIADSKKSGAGSQEVYNPKVLNANENLTTEVLQSVQNHLKRPAIVNDRFDIFGANVAAKLRDITKQQRILAEKVINETLFLTEMENFTISHQVTDSSSVRFTNYSYNVPSPVSHTPSPVHYQNSNFEGSQSILQTSQQGQSQPIQNSAANFLSSFDINTN
ncbi:uncharacterized protein LOC126978880, partial [Leptidea sinapis]|uniref:uncharacterized protein LOC126978880 n=1 Tax=Leptidea sinapis TaxID=189913 RepID=UPI0021C29C30